MSKIGLLFLESLSSVIGGIMYNQNVTISTYLLKLIMICSQTWVVYFR